MHNKEAPFLELVKLPNSSLFQFLDKKSLLALSLVNKLTSKFVFSHIDQFKFKHLDEKILEFIKTEIGRWKDRNSQLPRFDFGVIKSAVIENHSEKIKEVFQLLTANNIPYSFESTNLDFIKLVRVLDQIDFKKNLEGITLHIMPSPNKNLEAYFLATYFPHLLSLKVLSIFCEKAGESIPATFSLSFPNLEKLKIITLSGVEEELLAPALPVSLRELVIPASYLLAKGLDLSQQCPHLKELKITKWSEKNIESIELIAQLSNLRKLKISTCYEAILYLDFSKLFQLEELNITFRGNEIRYFALPSKLRKLAISGSESSISVYQLEENIDLSQQCPHLKELINQDCTGHGLVFSALPNTLTKLKISTKNLPTANFDFAKELPFLEELKIYYGEEMANLTFPSTLRKLEISTRNLPKELPLLEELKIHHDKEIANLALPNTLRKLKISTKNLPTANLDFAKELPLLEELEINHGEEVANLTLPNTLRKLKISLALFLKVLDLSQQCPHLEELQISHDEEMANLTLPSTLKKLIIPMKLLSKVHLDLPQQYPHLKELNITDFKFKNRSELESIISNLAKLSINLKCLIINNVDYIEKYLQDKNKLSLSEKAKVASVFADKPKENNQRNCAEISCTIL